MMELKWLYEGACSMSDVSSYNGSNMSLDDVMESSVDHCISNDVHDTEFRERTTSLQIPRKSRVTRIRWKSNEIIWQSLQCLLKWLLLKLPPWLTQILSMSMCLSESYFNIIEENCILCCVILIQKNVILLHCINFWKGLYFMADGSVEEKNIAIQHYYHFHNHHAQLQEFKSDIKHQKKRKIRRKNHTLILRRRV